MANNARPIMHCTGGYFFGRLNLNTLGFFYYNLPSNFAFIITNYNSHFIGTVKLILSKAIKNFHTFVNFSVRLNFGRKAAKLSSSILAVTYIH